MPRIQIPYSDGEITVARQPRGGVEIPVVAPPEVSMRSAGMVGNAIAGLGQSFSQMTDTAVNIAQIEGRQRHAQDVLDAEGAKQTYIGEAAKVYDRLRALRPEEGGDPFALPENLERELKDLQFRMGESLRPGARRIFQGEAQQYQNVLLPKARDVRVQQQEAQRKTQLFQSIDTHTQGIVSATDPAERQYHQDALLKIQQDFSTALLLGPEETAGLIRKVTNDVTVGTIRRDMRLEPVAAIDALREQAEQGVLDIGGVPIAKLIDEGTQVLDADVRRQEAIEVRQERERVKVVEQDLRLADAEMTNPNASIEQLVATRNRLTKLAQDRDLPDEAVTPRLKYLNSQIGQAEGDARMEAREARREQREARAEARERARMAKEDDTAAVIRMTQRVYGTNVTASPEDVFNEPGIRNPATIRQLTDTIRERRRQDHVSNIPEFGQGKSLIDETIMGPASMFAVMESSGVPELEDLAKKRRENAANAQTEYFRAASGMSGPEGIDTTTFKQTWESTARDISERYKTMGEPPRPRAGFETKEAIVNAWRDKKITKPQMEADLLILDMHQKYRGEVAEAQAELDRIAREKAEKAAERNKSLWQRVKPW